MLKFFGVKLSTVYILYALISFVQFFAIAAGIHEWWGLNSFFAIIIAFIVSYIPIVGSVIGVAGAIEAWNWTYFGAILLFFWYFVLLIIYGVFEIISFIFHKLQNIFSQSLDNYLSRSSTMQKKYSLTWGQATTIWWSMIWRYLFYFVVLSVLFGIVGGMLGLFMHMHDKIERGSLIGIFFILGIICNIPMSILAVKQALTKHMNLNADKYE